MVWGDTVLFGTTQHSWVSKKPFQHRTACTETYNQKILNDFIQTEVEGKSYRSRARTTITPESAIPIQGNPIQQLELCVAHIKTTRWSHALNRKGASQLLTIVPKTVCWGGEGTGQGEKRWQRLSPSGSWLLASTAFPEWEEFKSSIFENLRCC